MADLNIKDVDDEVKEITDQMARERNMSTQAYVRDVLRRNADRELRHRRMLEADSQIAAVRAQLDLSRLTSTGAQLVREAREEYERGETEREAGA